MIAEPLADCSLLIVDDEEANLDLLEALLEAEGYRRVTRASDARKVVQTWDECAPDLVLLDLHMPHRTGFDILRDLRERTAADDYRPVLVLTADVTQEARDRALSEGARDFLTKPFDAVEVLLRVRNLLETRQLHRMQRDARVHAEAAERRAGLLAEVSRVLTASLDSDTALAQVANLLVRDVADACGFLLLHGDEVRIAAQAALGGAGRPSAFDETSLATDVAAAIEVGGVRVLDVGGDPLVLAPIVGPSGAVGVIALSVPDPGSICEADLSMMEELAARTALALENAQLFADAQLASRARESMLSVVAHDLRNPLAVVGMYAEMLLDLLPPESDPYAAEALTSIHRSSQRMQHQIEDLLDVSRLQHGTFAVRPAPCVARDLFAEAELLLRPLALARSIELVVEGDDVCGDAAVPVDGVRFQQLISNLVGNALKFTPEGGRVVLGWSLDDEELAVRVTDSGPGIPREQVPHVFGAFWQARDADRRGIGLGLWISRAIVEAHGGRIWIDSVEGEGATFHFVIPIRMGESAGTHRSGGSLTHAPLPLPS
ncbi:MAG: ATP-binding protein [Gemmatimonadota bacterium]